MQTDPRLYRRFFSRLLTLIPTDNKKDFSISDKIEKLMASYREKSNKFCDSMVNLESSFKIQLKSIESFLGKEKVYEPRWSVTLKGSKIKILKSIAEQSGMESSGQRFCLMDEQLSQSTFCLIQTKPASGPSR